MEAVYVGFIVIVAMGFDLCNGFNDAANSVATVVATRVLSPRKAVLWAAFFNFLAAFLGTPVAKTIGKGIVDPKFMDPHMILAALIAAIIWTVVCTNKGIPISVSHALIGSLAGVAITKAGWNALVWTSIGKIALFIFLSPLIGMALGFVMMVAVYWICHLLKLRPGRVDGTFRVLQLFSAACYSVSHGFNDAQKTMGIIFALLLSVPSMAHLATRTDDPHNEQLAWWIILSCNGAIALGTYMGGWKVIATLGHKVVKLMPMHGFCAEAGGGVTILAVSAVGIPVSTTHTITGAIFGVGMTRGLNSIRWAVGRDILIAWVLTLPVSALIAAALYLLIRPLVYHLMPC